MKTIRAIRGRAARSLVDQRGFTLIELMIALVLGLIVSGAALALFVTNKRTYVASENMGRVQENARTAFELMSRDVREAGGNPCDANVPIGNALNDTSWWSNWGSGVTGYNGAAAFAGAPFGTSTGARVNGTDAIELRSGVDTGIAVIGAMPDPSANIDVQSTSGISNNDLVMICDFNQAAIFQVTQTPAGLKIQHNKGAGNPGNCTKDLEYPIDCSGSAHGQPFTEGAHIAKLRVSGWYVGCNGRTDCATPQGRSLYQVSVDTPPTLAKNEITEGVNNMTLKYLVDGGTDYVLAGAVADWNKVVAVYVDLEMVGQDKVSTDNDVLRRHLLHVVTLRNRAQ
ncbi:MAG: PilW family protein [Luteimonas sp.]